MTDLFPDPGRVTPIPAGRGRWRIEIGQRSFANRAADVIGEIMDARSRRLVRGLNKPAQFNFTVDGHSPTARLLRELEHEVFVYRWSEITGRDEEYFRGTITQSQDILSEQRHTDQLRGPRRAGRDPPPVLHLATELGVSPSYLGQPFAGLGPKSDKLRGISFFPWLLLAL